MWGYGDTQIISAPWTPNDNVWYHLAITREGSSLRLFVDGTQIGTTVSSSVNALSGSNLIIGALYYGSALFPLNGYLDEIRITKGIARYTTNFTPSTVPFEYAEKTYSLLSKSLMTCAPGFNPIENKALRESVPNWEYWDSGDKFIEGTVHYNGNLAQRKVRLYRLIDGQIIRETWSDANGFYRFDRLKDQQYYIWSEDYLRVYDPVSHLVLNQG